MKILTLTCGAQVLLDDEDYERIPKTGWYLSAVYCHNPNTDYVQHDTYGKMHRYILGITDRNIVVDHLDHNGLNNQKNNLRLCSTSENKKNITTHYPNNSLSFTGVKYEPPKDNRKPRFRALWSEGTPQRMIDGKKRGIQKSKSFSFIGNNAQDAKRALKEAILYRIKQCRKNGYILDERSTTIEQAILTNFNCDIEALLKIDIKLYLVE